MNDEMIRKLIPLLSIIFFIGFLIIIFLIIRGIWRSFKNFVLEVIDHIKGAGSRTGVSTKDYTAEARKACENVPPKRNRNDIPPWEE